MGRFSILVVDDERLQRETLAAILTDHSCQVTIARDADEAASLLRKSTFDMMLTDMRMPGGGGIHLARLAREVAPDTATLIMTAYADVDSVIEALRAGVVDYLLKPINVPSLLRKVEILKERRDLVNEVQFLRSELSRQQDTNYILGSSAAMIGARKLIEQVASTRGTVLITGESGTGKEIAAREIHRIGSCGARTGAKFVAINCGAIPENLLESELFGHKKGAFTGAVSDKDGLFVIAHGGTLFLDEIGDMPKSLQVKLLRALQEREVVPVGDSTPIKIDVRIIAATNRDLAEDVESGVFRKDLFYRINVVEVKMPPLRDHADDIPNLAKHFIDKFSRDMGKPSRPLTGDAIRRLICYPWPGNVRELENVIERAMILGTGDRIDACDLPPGFQNLGLTDPSGDSDPFNLDRAVSAFCRTHITKTLDGFGGDKKSAAKALGMGLSSLYRKLEELGITTTRQGDDK